MYATSEEDKEGTKKLKVLLKYICLEKLFKTVERSTRRDVVWEVVPQLLSTDRKGVNSALNLILGINCSTYKFLYLFYLYNQSEIQKTRPGSQIKALLQHNSFILIGPIFNLILYVFSMKTGPKTSSSVSLNSQPRGKLSKHQP